MTRTLAVLLALSSPLALAQVKVKGKKGTVEVNADGTVVKDGQGNTVEVGGGAVKVKGKHGEVEAAGVAQESAQGNEIEIDGTGVSRTIECKGGQTEVEVNGTGNKITVTGECKEVEVNGTGNSVAIESAGRIEAHGINNKVSYKRGLEGKEPKLVSTGMNNAVTRAAL